MADYITVVFDTSVIITSVLILNDPVRPRFAKLIRALNVLYQKVGLSPQSPSR